MTFDILATGSGGNCLVLNGGQIAIDMGVPYSKIQPYVSKLRLVLLTHIHGDHFNPATVGRLARERPTLRWACCGWMAAPLLEAGVDKRRIDVCEGQTVLQYYKFCDISSFPLVHDAPNCGWKIWTGGERILYATDTGTMDGVEARGYDYYFLEANYTYDELQARIEAKEAAGAFAYEHRVEATHLSQEQALEWLAKNMSYTSKYIFMHQHKERET